MIDLVWNALNVVSFSLIVHISLPGHLMMGYVVRNRCFIPFCMHHWRNFADLNSFPLLDTRIFGSPKQPKIPDKICIVFVDVNVLCIHFEYKSTRMRK